MEAPKQFILRSSFYPFCGFFMQQGQIITLFGGTGFLGRHLVPLLAREGFTLRLPVRSLDKALPLKIGGAPGQIVPFLASSNNDISVAKALHGADAVVNLIGTRFEKRRRTFQNVHVETAARLARIAQSEGVKKFVHLSALGADDKADSAYFSTKALGEKAIHTFFPEATILRPGVVFGAEDRFLNVFLQLSNWLPCLPLPNNGQTRFQPAHIDDVATAIVTCLFKKETQGKIYELGGPDILTLKTMIETMAFQKNKRPCLTNLPVGLALFIAFLFEFLPEPPLTRLLVKSLLSDAVLSPTSSCGTFADLGINPRSLKASLGTPNR